METIEQTGAVEERQVTTTRWIGAPRELVFRAWTEERHLARWFGPNGFSTETRVFEFRPGGVWDFDMIGPDGTVYPNWIQWRQIERPERISYRQGSRENDPDAFDGTVTFVERDGGTEITLRAEFATKARRDFVVETYRAVEGALQTLTRLETYVVGGGTAGGSGS